ncbi:MAG: hypothetical protein WCI40_02870 [Verrucomicrobiota bacterium]
MSNIGMVKIKKAASGAGDYKVSERILQPANEKKTQKLPPDRRASRIQRDNRELRNSGKREEKSALFNCKKGGFSAFS